MMISLQKLIPKTAPCIVEANDIERIYQGRLLKGEDYSNYLLLKLKNVDIPIELMYIGYSSDLSAEVMDKAAFTIQTAKGDTCQH